MVIGFSYHSLAICKILKPLDMDRCLRGCESGSLLFTFLINLSLYKYIHVNVKDFSNFISNL